MKIGRKELVGWGRRLQIGFFVFVEVDAVADSFCAFFVSVECCERESRVCDFESEVETASGGVSCGQGIEDVDVGSFV